MKSKHLLPILLLFIALGSTAQSGLTNMSFETWGTSMFGPAPTGWMGFNVTKMSSGAQQGSNYVRITNTSLNQGMLMLGTISTTNAMGGAPFNKAPVTLTGFYKTSGLASSDVVGISSYASKTGSINMVGTFTANVNVATWTSFVLTYLNFGSNAVDTLFMIVTTGNMGGGGDNSLTATLDIDNFSLTSLTGIDKRSLGTSFLVYPNPASEELMILSKDDAAVSVVVTNITGKTVDVISLETEKTKLDLQKYESGIYFYSILDKDKSLLLTNKFTVTK